MSARKTKAELQAEIVELQEDIEVLELSHHMDEMQEMKLGFAKYVVAFGFGTVLLAQILFAAFGKPSPFGGAFGWVLCGMAALYLLGFLVHNALLKGNRIHGSVEISEKHAKLKLLIEESERAKPAAEPSAAPDRGGS